MAWWIWMDGWRMALEGKAGEHSVCAVIQSVELEASLSVASRYKLFGKRKEARFLLAKIYKSF